MAPYVALEWRDVEIADDDRALARCRPQMRACAHLIEKREFVGEFRIDFGVGFVAARRHVVVMDFQRVAQAGLFAKHDADMTRIDLPQ